MEEVEKDIYKVYDEYKKCDSKRRKDVLLYDLITLFGYIEFTNKYEMLPSEILDIFFETFNTGNKVLIKPLFKFFKNYLERNKDFFIDFYYNNLYYLYEYVSRGNDISSKCNNNISNIDVIKNYNYEFYKYIKNNINNIDKFNNNNLAGTTWPITSLKKIYIAANDDIYSKIHELLHGYTHEMIFNSKNKLPIIYNFHDEIFSYSEELMFAYNIGDFEHKKNEIINGLFANLDNLVKIIYNTDVITSDHLSFMSECYKYFVGLTVSIKQFEIYLNNSDEYKNNMKYFYNNFYKFLKIRDLEKIGFDKNEAVSGKLIKKFINM